MSAVQAANDYIADYDPEAVDEPAEEDDDAARAASDDDEEGVDVRPYPRAEISSPAARPRRRH